MEKVRVDLPLHAYDILIEPGLRKQLTDVICSDFPSVRKLGIITDDNLERLYGRSVFEGLSAHQVEWHYTAVSPGERSKSLDNVAGLYEQLFDWRMDRGSYVVAFGGGVVGDLAGFVAATFMRGVPLIQVPTSLLAQVDSSVGGKVGVDHPRGKNLIGAFYQPKAVYIDPEFLETLPMKELRAGLAEVVKYGVIMDADFFAVLERDTKKILDVDGAVLTQVVRRCCELKRDVVLRDEKESHYRAILNYGHTIGHALEVLTGYTGFLHGEAVSLGMVCEGLIAKNLHLCSEDVVVRQAKLLRAFGLPTEFFEQDFARIVRTLYQDKKTLGGKLRMVLPKSIGKVEIVENVDPKLIERSLKEASRWRI